MDTITTYQHPDVIHLAFFLLSFLFLSLCSYI
jgi:hypothetical protein